MSGDLIRYAIKQEILDLLYARARGADRFDPALMRVCHPVDGTDNHGTYQGLMHGFIDALEKSMASGPVCLAKEHIIANALFEFGADGDVFVESYHVAHETFVDGDGTVFFHIGGRYLDTFRQVGGRWLIQHRDIVYDWSRVSPGPLAFPGPAQPADLRGMRTPDDPLYRHIQRGALPARPDPTGDIMTDPVQRLLDKQEIAEILYRRARAGDRSDAELAHTCYHEGATERHGMFDGAASEFIDVVSFTKPRPGSPIKGMMHVVTNILCDFADDTHAFAESYHVAWCQMTDGTDATIGGRYLDRFEKRDGRWGIVHRDVIFDWSRVEPETEKFWEKHPAKPFLFGRRGADDPLYEYTVRGK
ncbi:MAG: nuclear transport factor 2 family protein [Sphingomonas sp.]|uniref:nuclear transport factor 2 family protein n=1 Tax=Sphingomonas sp. TaxID=28214 RepID=UPI003561EBBC